MCDSVVPAAVICQVSTEQSWNQPQFGVKFIFHVDSYLPLENICIVIIWFQQSVS